MSKQLILPRKDKDGNYYISYSQISKYKRSKRDYIRQYFFGEDTSSEALKKYGDFGHRVGESYENNDFSSWDEEEKKFLKSLPHYDEYEREIKLQMKGFYVLGYIDTNTEATGSGKSSFVEHIGDYKTGDIEKRKPEYESDDYQQLDIYAAALHQEYGLLPKTAKVILVGRDGNAFKGEDLTLNKESAIINRKLSISRMKKVMKSVQETAEEISFLYQVFLKLKNNGND